MKNTLFTPSADLFESKSRRSMLLSSAVAALAVMASPTLQAQSDNWNDGDDTAGQTWTHYAPAGLGQTFTFPVNPADSSSAYRMTSGQGTTPNPGRVGSYLLGGPTLIDFTVSVDLINWDNSQSQNMGVAARVQTPLSPTSFPSSYALVYANRFSAGGGGTDQLRLYKTIPTTVGFMNNGLGNQGQFGVVAGGDAAPNPTNDYTLVFTGTGNIFTGQIIDKSTGLALTFNDGLGGLTNKVWASDPGPAAGFGALYNSGNVGLFAFVGGGGGASAMDPTYDNFLAVVPEPSVLALAGLGSAGVLWISCRRRQRR